MYVDIYNNMFNIGDYVILDILTTDILSDKFKLFEKNKSYKIYKIDIDEYGYYFLKFKEFGRNKFPAFLFKKDNHKKFRKSKLDNILKK